MKTISVLVLCAAAGCLGGCNYLSYLLYLGAPVAPAKTIEPEYKGYADMPGKMIAVIVYADQKTLYEYPDLREQISSVVGYHLTTNIDKLKAVDDERVTRYQERNPGWEGMDRTDLGRKLRADYLLYISVENFTTLDPGSSYLHRGHIEAQVALYKCSLPEKESCVWPGGVIQLVYPEGDTVGKLDIDDRELRNATIRKFSDLLAKKFYKHKERDEELEADKK